MRLGVYAFRGAGKDFVLLKQKGACCATYLFILVEGEANRLSHSLERIPEAFLPSSGACNGIPLHTPLLGSNWDSFESKRSVQTKTPPNLCAHPDAS